MEKQSTNENRRDFMKTLIPAGIMICMGCPTALSMNDKEDLKQEQDFDSKIKNEFSISWERYFKNRFNGSISWMKTFAEHFGKDNVIHIIKEQTDQWNLEGEPNMEAKSVKDFIRPIEESELYTNCLDYEYVELTDKVCQIKVNNCLWAKTFRDKDAGDFGYACICHGDFSGAKAFNPKPLCKGMIVATTVIFGKDRVCFQRFWQKGSLLSEFRKSISKQDSHLFITRFYVKTTVQKLLYVPNNVFLVHVEEIWDKMYHIINSINFHLLEIKWKPLRY